MNRIRVLVVDDSPLAREVIAKILEKDPDFSIVSRAENGVEAIRLTQKLRPDLIIMDLYMPMMDGFQAIEKIMAYQPTPILVATSALPREGKNLSFRALDLGALEVVEKPTLSPGETPTPKESDFIRLAKILSKVKVIPHLRGKVRKSASEPVLSLGKATEQFKTVAIASSTGGPKALLQIFRKLPKDLPAAIVVVQHIPEGFCQGLANWLDSESKLKVKKAAQGDKLKPGTVFIAPTGYHMIIKNTGKIVLSSDPPVMSHRPSGNILLKSVAESYGPSAIGIILSGMGTDGAEGIQAIRNRGGKTIAQSERDCVVFGMPKAAIQLGAVDRIVPLDSIAPELLKMLS